MGEADCGNVSQKASVFLVLLNVICSQPLVQPYAFCMTLPLHKVGFQNQCNLE